MLAFLALGCSSLPSAKTIDDAANMACEVLAQEQAAQAQKMGVSINDVHQAVKDACDAKDEVQPWIDALLATKQEQEAVVGARMGLKRDQ